MRNNICSFETKLLPLSSFDFYSLLVSFNTNRIKCNALWHAQYTRLVLIYGAKMQISVQMAELSKVTQFNGVLFIALFFIYFFLKLIAWVPCGISL